MKKRAVSRKKQLSGFAKMKASGAVAVMLTMRPEDREMIRKAAQIDGRTVAGFVRFYALNAADALLLKEYSGG